MSLLSIYGTVYNNAYVIDDSLHSLLQSLSPLKVDYELVISDNYSTDNTFEKLLNWKRRLGRKIKIIRAKCSRGKGREIALENTEGEYVAYVDFDCIFDKEFGDIVNKLCGICRENEAWRLSFGFGFSTRKTIMKTIGGWRDLNFGEDWELMARAAKNGVKLKTIAIKPPFRNIRTSDKGAYGEQRYTRNYFKYLQRRMRNILDAVRGWNLKPPQILRGGTTIRPSTIAMLFMSVSTNLNNLEKPSKEIVYANEQYIFPEELDLLADSFLVSWEEPHFYWSVVKKRIIELIEKDNRIKFKLCPYGNSWKLIGYRKAQSY